MISGLVFSAITMISDIVRGATMISGLVSIRRNCGGPFRDTCAQEVVEVLHEVAGVDLEDLVGVFMR